MVLANQLLRQSQTHAGAASLGRKAGAEDMVLNLSTSIRSNAAELMLVMIALVRGDHSLIQA